MCRATILTAPCCLFLLGLFLPPAAAEDGAIAHWTFDRLVGETLPDSTSNRRDATNHGAKPVAGAKDGALAFDGRDDYVT